MVLFSALTVPTDIRHQQDATCAYVNGNCLQIGTLYIAESEIRWINSTGFGFTLEYPNVAAHAISKSDTSFPHDSLYVSLDSSLPGEDGDNVEMSTEVRFVPTDSNALTEMFQALASCQRLHPDNNGPEEDGQYNDDDDDGYDDEDGVYNDDNPEDDDYNDDDVDDDDATEADRHVRLMPESDQAIHSHIEVEGGARAEQSVQEGVACLNLSNEGHPSSANHSNDVMQAYNGHAHMDTGDVNHSALNTSNPDPEADQFLDAECDS